MPVRPAAGAELPKALTVWTAVMSALAIPVAIVLIVAGFGILERKRWARTASLLFAAYAILIVLVDGFITAAFPVQGMGAVGAGAEGEAVAIGRMVGMVFGMAMRIAYPVCVLVFMTRPWFVAAFPGREPAPAAEQDDEVLRLR